MHYGGAKNCSRNTMNSDMKINILLALMVAILSWVTCKNFQKSQGTENASANTGGPTAGPSGWKASRVIDGSNPDSAGTFQVKEPPLWVNIPVDALPPASASRKAYLSTGYWHLNMAFQPSDTTVHVNYQSKWLRFREDQTFDILIKGKVVESGRWNWEEVKNEIFLACKDPYVNNSWQVIDKGFVMIWKGNTALNVTGIQVRVVGARSLPSQ